VGFFGDRAKKGVFGVGTKIGHFFAPVFRDVEFYNFINFAIFAIMKFLETLPPDIHQSNIMTDDPS